MTPGPVAAAAPTGVGRDAAPPPPTLSPAAQSDMARALDDAGTATGPEVFWSLDDLRASLASLKIRRPLVVLSREALAASGLALAARAPFAGVDALEFFEFSPNPKAEEAAHAARLAAQHGADGVVAIGGGSCADVAKVAALAARTPGLIDALARGERPGDADPLPLIVAPTTSGTGSEATHFAAIYVGARKVSVAHPRLRPVVAILDARLHIAMPRALAAVTGLDALGQALESMWAVGSTDDSFRLATLAARLIAPSLVRSVRTAHPDDRARMMLGAHLAGRAINISKTTAAHALSYQFTQRFGLPHGHAVALTLGHLARANADVTPSDCNDPRGVDHVRSRVHHAAACLSAAPADMPAVVRQLLADLGLPATLGEAGVPAGALSALAADADPVRFGNNPRRLTPAQTADLLREAI